MLKTNSQFLSFQEKQYVNIASELSGQAYDIDLWQKHGDQQ